MDTPRDAILDLLPLYLAGEARPGTRQVVTEYLSRHPELAAQVRQQAETEPAVDATVLALDLEARALLQTRRSLAVRQWLFGITWFFTAISIAFTAEVDATGVHHVRLLFARYPVAHLSIVAAAVIGWMSYLRLRRRTHF